MAREGQKRKSTRQDALVRPTLGADNLTALATVMSAIRKGELGRADCTRLDFRVWHPHRGSHIGGGLLGTQARNVGLGELVVGVLEGLEPLALLLVVLFKGQVRQKELQSGKVVGIHCK